jgi:mRNA-degrading endonuclease RelE of RelBE toxin-antitoxin system
MSFSVIPSDKFKKEAKRLSKKYVSLKEELSDLNDTLSNTPETGTPLGNDTYKIRLAIKSKGKGKSGGGRVITYVVKANKEVYLLAIYDKSEFENVDDKTLKNIIQSLNQGD